MALISVTSDPKHGAPYFTATGRRRDGWEGMEAAGSCWKLLDAVGVCHRYFIQDQVVAREASGRPASSGRW